MKSGTLTLGVIFVCVKIMKNLASSLTPRTITIKMTVTILVFKINESLVYS